MNLRGRLRWLAFRLAPVRFHILRDPADPTAIYPRLRSEWRRWARTLCPEPSNRRAFIEIHRKEIEGRLASPVRRERLVLDAGSNVRIEWIPTGTVFVYKRDFSWGRLLWGRRIDLTLERIEMPRASDS